VADQQGPGVLSRCPAGEVGPGEVPGLPLLADLDLTGVVVSGAAPHTHPDAAEDLVAGKQVHYLLIVKPTSPGCWTGAPAWPGVASPSWTAPATAATAALSCNLAIGALCRAGPVNLAAALRHHAVDPARPLTTLGIIPV
jgi:hypothetical protein